MERVLNDDLVSIPVNRDSWRYFDGISRILRGGHLQPADNTGAEQEPILEPPLLDVIRLLRFESLGGQQLSEEIAHAGHTVLILALAILSSLRADQNVRPDV